MCVHTVDLLSCILFICIHFELTSDLTSLIFLLCLVPCGVDESRGVNEAPLEGVAPCDLGGRGTLLDGCG